MRLRTAMTYKRFCIGLDQRRLGLQGSAQPHLTQALPFEQTPKTKRHEMNECSSLTVQERWTGAQNYKAWRRAIEIGLSTKHKLGFVKGTVVRYATDENLAEL
ncbi:cysteine-rich receptor-like protein kinase 8 [Tanacetum coccineum]